MLGHLRKSAAMVLPGRRLAWLAVSLLALAVGVIEGGAAGTVYLLVRVMQNPQSIVDLPVVGVITGRLAGASDSTIMLISAGAVGVYHVAKNALLLTQQYFQYRVLSAAHMDLSQTLLRGYLYLPYPFHFRRHSSELIRNATSAVEGVIHTLALFDVMLREILIGLAILSVLIVAAPAVTFTSVTVLVLLVVGLLRATRRAALQRGADQHELSQVLYRTVQNALSGIKEIKALGREDHFFDAFKDAQRRQVRLGFVGITLNALPPLLIETVFVLAALAVATVVAVQPGSRDDILPLLGLFAYAGFRMIPMANRLVLKVNDIRATGPAVTTVYDDWVVIRNHADVAAAHGDQPRTLRTALELVEVGYSYPAASRPALSGVTFTLPAGLALGIVGATGAGKSTLVDLVVGLLPPTTGQVLADGLPISEHSRGWRQRIGYVPQAIFLLDDTLRRNIAMGIADHDIDEAAVTRAIRMAQLETLVASWPEGVETRLGERGIRLSGGERQRVGIARALYHNPDLLIFDEATSALDTITEAEITRAIESLRGTTSMLVIAHRLSTVRRCDRLVLLEGGRMVAQGTYDELLTSDPRFRRMAEAGQPLAGALHA